MHNSGLPASGRYMCRLGERVRERNISFEMRYTGWLVFLCTGGNELVLNKDVSKNTILFTFPILGEQECP